MLRLKAQRAVRLEIYGGSLWAEPIWGDFGTADGCN